MATPTSPEQSSVNAWLEEELRQQYRNDRTSVDPLWKTVFENGTNSSTNGSGSNRHALTTTAPNAVARPTATAAELAAGDPQVLRGVSAKIAENMAASVAIPLATSQRIIPVKVIDENRRLINHHRALLGRGKVSYTHILGWAIVRSVKSFPGINNAFAWNEAGEPVRVVKSEINFGLAVDVEGKGGTRSLVVPNIRNAGSLSFTEYKAAFDDLVARARVSKLMPQDFSGTTISLTNPGTVGTMASNPRLISGQGAIVAVGAMDYPAQYRGVAPDTLVSLGIGKVMSVTCTYDHRIIQGAESGMFLGKLQSLLDGDDHFYEEIFEALQVPYAPVKWTADQIPGLSVGEPSPDVVREAAVIQLIHAYRVRGHMMAGLDPLGTGREYNSELDPLTYGLTIWDLDRYFYAGTLQHAFGERKQVTLREMLELLRATYCGKIGAEYMYIQKPEEKVWLQHQIETKTGIWPETKVEKIRILEDLFRGEEFERFLDRRFIGQKRFSLEGAETTIALLSELLNRAADTGVHEIIIGMAHRGRLNVLANIIGKPLGQIFSEFEGNIDPASAQGSGDVKYHLGATGTQTSPAGNPVTVSLAANPSHLEAVNPVVEGMVRARQDGARDVRREKYVPVLIHGDAAFAGQGVVAETLNLSQLEGYGTGGTIHLVINNQIGFTTLPEYSRSTLYATDIARMVQAPIFHVNGDDPEASIRVLRLAYDYRQQFKRDVVVDIVCYRRHGHNEADDPAYTQPVMYRKIEKLPSVAVQYSERLVREKVLSAADATALRQKISAHLNEAFDRNKAQGKWVLQPPKQHQQPNTRTCVSRQHLEQVVRGVSTFPEDFHLHPKLEGFIKKRRDSLAGSTPVDWAFAEAIAFGSLALEGVPVRLSGQDSGRGTFSQRHLAYYDYQDGHRYVPMEYVSPDQAKFEVLDSSLSEFGVLGFEYGFSVADPYTLTIWEAQFGDFSNGAQIIIDQFITTGEQKWGQASGVVLLLPHGYEGQGPEHSSGRMERFLSLCAEDNIRVANCSTPAQYFHILRRQAVLPLKPLVVFTPKSLLRSPKAVSTLQELTDGEFKPVLGDDLDPATVRRVVFCTGKVYYDLLAARDTRPVKDVALVRIEDLYPFPQPAVQAELSRFKPDVEVVWCQEEPRNMGAWRQMASRLRDIGRVPRYVGRTRNASPAAGSPKRHAEEQKRLVDEALA
ncbi:MAG: 2-oxoglutarate dehydrogenase component [Bryobacterales bacterium]|nr:2-oxoglutarate dehydrogenase component [Bryobacterales bacterium]